MSTAERLLAARRLDETRAARFASRKRVNQVALTLSLLAEAHRHCLYLASLVKAWP